MNYCAENISFITGHPWTFLLHASLLNISARDFEVWGPVEKFVYNENLWFKGHSKDVFLVPLASSNFIDPLFPR